MEPVFKANRKRVYEALTDAKQFDKVIQLSAAVKTGMAKSPNPPEISREAGERSRFLAVTSRVGSWSLCEREDCAGVARGFLGCRDLFDCEV